MAPVARPAEKSEFLRRQAPPPPPQGAPGIRSRKGPESLVHSYPSSQVWKLRLRKESHSRSQGDQGQRRAQKPGPQAGPPGPPAVSLPELVGAKAPAGGPLPSQSLPLGIILFLHQTAPSIQSTLPPPTTVTSTRCPVLTGSWARECHQLPTPAAPASHTRHGTCSLGDRHMPRTST